MRRTEFLRKGGKENNWRSKKGNGGMLTVRGNVHIGTVLHACPGKAATQQWILKRIPYTSTLNWSYTVCFPFVIGNPILFREMTEHCISIFFISLKVHKIENFFGSDFEFCVISLLVMLKY
jgi:hypothetical protein